MIIKASARVRGARSLANHLLSSENERVRVVEIVGTMADNLLDAFRDFEAVGSGSRSNRPYYHVSFSPGHALTPEQRERTIELFEEKMGLTGQPRVVVEHFKEDREHFHVVWQRYDLQNERMIDYSYNYRRHEQVSRQLEKEFGHERVVGAHERDKEQEKRPERAPSHAEQQQGKRLGLNPRAITAELSQLYGAAKSGAEFKHLVETKGYRLAQGDRRDFVVVDAHGGVHSLARRLQGETAATVREKLSDIDRASLPKVEEAKAERIASRKGKGEDESRGVSVGRAANTPALDIRGADLDQLEQPSPQMADARSQTVKPAAAAGLVGGRVGADVANRAEGAVADLLVKPLEKVMELLSDLVAPPGPPTEEQIKRAVEAREAAERPRAPWEMKPAELNKWVRDQEAKVRNEMLERGVDPRRIDDAGERRRERGRD